MRADVAQTDIRELREEFGYTQARLGKLVGVCARTVWQWETNRSKISPRYRGRVRELRRLIERTSPGKYRARGRAANAETWAKSLRSRRLQVGLTQAELADLAGVTRPSISDYERGVRQASRNVIKRIDDILG